MGGVYKKSKLKCDRCGRRIEKNEDGTLRATVSKFTMKGHERPNRYCWRCPI